MRILASTDMETNNPKLAFYSLLLEFILSQRFDAALARSLEQAAITHRDQITMPDVTFESLKLWHKQYKSQNLPGDPGIEKYEEASSYAFADLAPQVKTEAARSLLRHWALSDNLYIHIRRSKSYGDGFESLTIVTDSGDTLRELLKNPDSFSGYVTFSEASEVPETERDEE